MQTFSSHVTAGLFWFIVFSVLGLVGSCAIPANLAPQKQNPPIAQPEASSAHEDSNAVIWSRLRQGTGYVVLLRHAQTVSGTGDPPGFRLDNCATQRNLSAAGRVQANRIGQTFAGEGINIVQVFSSQYCRCLKTAELMNIGTVEPTQMLNSIFEDRSTADTQVQQTKQQILNHRGKAGIIVMVTHYANISAVSGISPQPGDAVVLRADDQGAIEVVGQLQDL